MSFNVAAEAYDQFMGRYSGRLAPLFADFAGIEPGQRALDVGCGPGALTGELVRRLGPAEVTACDPSPPFVEAAQLRNPNRLMSGWLRRRTFPSLTTPSISLSPS